MNAVKVEVEDLNGTIDIKSTIDLGTKILIDLPLYK
jgi:chemotaxis protein histidine kinase CheA